MVRVNSNLNIAIINHEDMVDLIILAMEQNKIKSKQELIDFLEEQEKMSYVLDLKKDKKTSVTFEEIGQYLSNLDIDEIESKQELLDFLANKENWQPYLATPPLFD